MLGLVFLRLGLLEGEIQGDFQGDSLSRTQEVLIERGIAEIWAPEARIGIWLGFRSGLILVGPTPIFVAKSLLELDSSLKLGSLAQSQIWFDVASSEWNPLFNSSFFLIFVCSCNFFFFWKSNIICLGWVHPWVSILDLVKSQRRPASVLFPVLLCMLIALWMSDDHLYYDWLVQIIYTERLILHMLMWSNKCLRERIGIICIIPRGDR